MTLTIPICDRDPSESESLVTENLVSVPHLIFLHEAAFS